MQPFGFPEQRVSSANVSLIFLCSQPTRPDECQFRMSQVPQALPFIPVIFVQMLLISSVAVLIFEAFAVPLVTKRIGIRLSYRLGTVFSVLVYFLFPMLSALNGHDGYLHAAFGLLVFGSFACNNAVRSMYGSAYYSNLGSASRISKCARTWRSKLPCFTWF